MMSFCPEEIQRFGFDGYEYDDERHRARLFYSLDNAIHFTESYEFLGAGRLASHRQWVALDRALRYLHLAAGASYYKAAAPRVIEMRGEALSPAEAAFFEKLYVNGLAEFAYGNGLDLRDRIRFPFERASGAKGRGGPVDYAPEAGMVVPLGGGKDSIVTMEVLRRAAIPIRLLNVGESVIVDGIVAAANLPAIRVRRTLSRNLLELNRRGAYNGHVPISAILAFVFLAAGILYGFDTVVMSNERSANVGTDVGHSMGDDGGGAHGHVNHQYSKSMEFERDFRAFVRGHAVAGFEYYSLLRPLSELSIGRIFSGLPAYHDLFVSCNRAFVLDAGRGGPEVGNKGRWCNDCPKCRFVFLSLAPFFEKERLIQVFGRNLLDDASQAEGFFRLMGAGGMKPFDCVGEEKESIVAMMLLKDAPAWKEDCVVRRFSEALYPAMDGREALSEEVFAWSDEHGIPPGMEGLLRGVAGASSDSSRATDILNRRQENATPTDGLSPKLDRQL